MILVMLMTISPGAAAVPEEEVEAFSSKKKIVEILS